MSYDRVLVRTGGPIRMTDLYAYFDGRAHYEAHGDPESGFQAWYENPDTGVYFSFECDPGVSDEFAARVWPKRTLLRNIFMRKKGPRADRVHAILFNMNVVRPHPFAFEAAKEIVAI